MPEESPSKFHPNSATAVGRIPQEVAWDHSPVWGEVYRSLDKPQFRIWIP